MSKKTKEEIKRIKQEKLERDREKCLKYGWLPVKLVTKPKAKTFKRRSKSYGSKFLSSPEWRRLRMQVIKKYGPVCMCCGASPKTGAVINVDHIKPRKLFPDLSLDINNLQILCGACNHGKGNWDTTDWRPK
jgi:5-methylcytosine-specific restriction endonuclease McrA